MGTIVGVRSLDGVVLAADRRVVTDGTVRSDDVQKLHEFDAAAVALEGSPGDLQAFARQLRSEIDRLETSQETAIRITALERLVSRLAEETAVEALLSARDADRIARLRSIDGTGGAYEETVAAWGSGAQLALGRLETLDADVPLDEVELLLRETFDAIAERDSTTGTSVDVCSLADQ